jgi:hypothetical protein
MIQRRKAHLHTHFTVHTSLFKAVAHRLASLSADTISDVAEIIENERSTRSLTDEQKNALDLLRYVNTISEKIPGSYASKISTRADIRNFFSYFGLAHLFVTFTPSPLHSPVFQVMYGDKTIDLSSRFPKIPPSSERARRLAHDPVAAADFFEFSVKTLFESLLGWDFSKRQSSETGGIWGRLRAFYGTTEYTERGSLHGHFLIWLEGAGNPSDIHGRLNQSTEYQSRFFDFFESIIHHHLPDVESQAVDSHYNPRIERPPASPDSSKRHDNDWEQNLKSWDSLFVTEIKKCGEVLQRHKCRPVCHKYGNTDRCRFLFPHEIVEASYFDPETNTVALLCRDGNVNYFNP